MPAFWNWVDRVWLSLASVKLTIVIFVALLLLAIPGTVFLQFNISNVDPGMQYDYDFWRFGNWIQLFSSYHSFWYSGLIGLLAMNLIACSVERWPQMYKLATAQPVWWSEERFRQARPEFFFEWSSKNSTAELKERVLDYLSSRRVSPQILADEPKHFQVFWQTGRWSRVANYLVHTSLLVVFLGAIVSALSGFEGVANIPAGDAVDSFLVFKEGKSSGLESPPSGGLLNERLLGFRVEVEDFDVSFWEGYADRPKEFVSKLNILREGKVLASKTIRVNDPLEFENFTFYQASYGRLGDYKIVARVIDKKEASAQQISLHFGLGKPQTFSTPSQKETTIVAMKAALNVQNLGPGVLFQQFEGTKPVGDPFWVLKDYPFFDIDRRKDSNYGVVVDQVSERFFTGLQIGYDPGAPIYWLGTLGMLIGTFWALFVTHKKYYLNFANGQFMFTASTHRLPIGFEEKVSKWAKALRSLT